MLTLEELIIKKNAGVLEDQDAVRYLELTRRANNPAVSHPAASAAITASPDADGFCGYDSDGHHPLPADARANAKYCDRACQQAAYRNRRLNG